MTWGTHCSRCGREDCRWDAGGMCEGATMGDLAPYQHHENLADKKRAEDRSEAFIVLGIVAVVAIFVSIVILATSVPQ